MTAKRMASGRSSQRKANTGRSPRGRQLAPKELIEHKAMIAKREQMLDILADAKVLEAEWNRHTQKVVRRLKLKGGEAVDDDTGKVVAAEGG